MTTKEESAKRIGTQILGKWQLEALLGYSSLAATYKAAHRNGLDVAMKIIHRSHCESAVVVERFLQEAYLANRIDHAGVERIFDDGTTEDGCVFLVMELLEGETLELRRASAGGRLRVLDARPIFDGILDVLVAIHAAGVVHRNLKPANVFLAKDGRVVLTDFGRARFADGDPSSAVSLENFVSGTPAFMPPEQARGKRSEVDERSDVWSTGAIFFQTLSGHRVHDARTTQERLALAQTKPARPIASVLPDLPTALAAVIDRALAFEKKDRWQSIEEMRRAYWAATGRDPSTLPPGRAPAQRVPVKMPETPPDGWPPFAAPGPSKVPALRAVKAKSLAATERTKSVAPPKLDADGRERANMRDSIGDTETTAPDPNLLPPVLSAFAPAPQVVIVPPSKTRTRIAIVFAVLFAGLAAGLVALLYSNDEPPKAPPAVPSGAAPKALPSVVPAPPASSVPAAATDDGGTLEL